MTTVFCIFGGFMDNLVESLKSINFNSGSFWIAAGILLVGSLVLGLFARFVFGQKSILNVSVSSAFDILFIYGLTVILSSSGLQLSKLVVPLPFVSIASDSLLLFDFLGAHYTILCSQLLSMIILAFLVNLVDCIFPKKKNFFIWILFRILTIGIGYALHLLVTWLFSTYLPEGIVTYAPVVLIAILLLMLLTGALKILIGALISTVNPIIGALYTFFFANIIGRQITKAVLTTAIISGLMIALQHAGVTAIAITSAALVAYLPIIILLVIVWYLLCCIL